MAGQHWKMPMYMKISLKRKYFPESRCKGVGAALIHAAVNEAGNLSWSKMYLYCSGTLPQYYEKLGWHQTGVLKYRDKTRIIMEIAI